MAKFGKKNKIKVTPEAYNVGIIGESGVGKTTLMKETLEQLVGEDGYMILNIGREDGVDALPDASYEDIPDFETLESFVEDVVENREDYADLKVVVVDTLDELYRITEPEVVRLHNISNPPDKQVTSIKAAFGGFQAGEEKAIELIIETLWMLNDVGVKVWFVGHTKRKTVSDVATGDEYDTLTSNLPVKYFNAIKTKLHFLGVASVDRSIEKMKVKQKIGKDKEVGKVVGENRIITFRDNNFNIDSKSRFSEITPQIELSPDQFIEALKDAIQKAHDKQKNKKSLAETKVEQEVEREEKIKENLEEIADSVVNVEENEELLAQFIPKFKEANDEVKLEAKEFLTSHNISIKDVSNVPTKLLKDALAIVA